MESVLLKDQFLKQGRSASCVCQFQSAALIVGGFAFIGGTAQFTNFVDVFDHLSETYKSNSTLLIPRPNPTCATDVANNKCYVLGDLSATVEVLTYNPTLFTTTHTTLAAVYPIDKVSNLACVFLNSVIYCAGGTTDNNIAHVAQTYYLNLTAATPAWVAGDLLPSVTAYKQCSYSAVFGTTIAFCGGQAYNPLQPAVADVGNCYLWDTTKTANRITTVSGLQNHSVRAFVVGVNYPSQKILVFGGLDTNTSQAKNVLDVVDFSTKGVTSTSNISGGLYEAVESGGSGSAVSVWTQALFVGGTRLYDLATRSGFVGIHVVDFYGGVMTTKLYNLNKKRLGAAVSTYQNKVFIHGGYGAVNSNGDVAQLEVLTLGCSAADSAGIDRWVSNSTYNGCDLLECSANYYGPSCTACSCNDLVCRDGVAGDGACFCPAGTYGAGCSGICNCGVGGVCDDGAGTGACTCKPGYSGPNCTTGPTACGANGFVDTASTNPISGCLCKIGYYGATCQNACNCGVNGLCNDTAAGDGSCVCLSGYFSSASGPNNSDGAKICNAQCDCSGNGVCDFSGGGGCQCYDGFFGATCAGSCLPNCATVGTQTYRCNDGVTGDGSCIPLAP